MTVVLLLLPFLPTSAGAQDDSVEFSVAPRLCVMDKAQVSCGVVVQIKWRASSLLGVCVHRRDNELPLQCWQSAQQGEFEIAVESDVNLVFELRRATDQRILAEAALQVVQENEVRRRRRSPWTFF